MPGWWPHPMINRSTPSRKLPRLRGENFQALTDPARQSGRRRLGRRKGNNSYDGEIISPTRYRSTKCWVVLVTPPWHDQPFHDVVLRLKRKTARLQTCCS